MFKYLRANSVQEACDWLAKYDDEAKVIAGGQSMVYLLKQKMLAPQYVIDISGLEELSYIRADESGTVRIGGLTTHRFLEKSPLINELCPMLVQVEQTLASVAIRNRGTLGGSLAHSDPSSDLTPALIALGAKLTLTSAKGKRTMDVEEFCQGYFETAIQYDELITEIEFNVSKRGRGHFCKFAQRSHDTAIVNVALYLELDPTLEDVCKDARIVVGSIGAVPQRQKNAEQLLKGKPITAELIEAASQAAGEEAEPMGYLNGSPQYQSDIIPVLVGRSITAAIAQG